MLCRQNVKLFDVKPRGTGFKMFLKDDVYENMVKHDNHSKLCLKSSYYETRCRPLACCD